MGVRVCPNCKYKFFVDIGEYCTVCGYYMDYIPHMGEWTIAQMKERAELIRIRRCMCSMLQGGDARKGFLVNCTMTNRGMDLEVFQKYENGIFVRKSWKFKENPRFHIPYEEIVSIEPAVNQKGAALDHYVYRTLRHGALELRFATDANIRDKYPNIESEMRELALSFRGA